MHLHEILSLQNGLPQLFEPSAWTRKSGSVAILRPPIRTIISTPSNWSLRFAEKRYAPLGQALGLVPTKSALERSCVVPRHLALLAPLIELNSNSYLSAFLSNHRLDACSSLPPTPAVDYDESVEAFLFIAHPDYFQWVEHCGWKIPTSPNTFPMTKDPHRAAALARQMTTRAKEAALAGGVPNSLLEAFIIEPTGRPFMTVRPNRDGFRLYGSPNIARFAINCGFEPINLYGAWETDNIKNAVSLVDLADPILKQALGQITNPGRLIAIDEIALKDIFQLIEDETKGKGTGPSEKAEAAEPRMGYSKLRSHWRTNDPFKAKAAGFTQSQDGYWITGDIASARQLRDVADIDAEIAIQNALADQYAAEIALIPDPPDPNPPEGCVYDPAQIEGIRFAIKNPRSLNADPMGFGKTIIGCGVIDVLRPRRVLILTLAGAVESWRRHLVMFLRDPPPIHIAKSYTPPSDGITILPNTSLANALEILSEPWDLVINDEAHKFKNADSKRSDALYEKIYGANSPRSLDMTGTPIPNKPQDLFNVLHQCLPEIFPNYDLYFRLYGLKRVQDDSPEKATLRRHLHRLLRRTIMIRRQKVMPVAKRRTTYVIKITDPDIKARLAAEISVWMAYEESRSFTERSRLLAEMTRMRRETAKFKIPETVDRIKLCKIFGDPFLVFGHHTELIDTLAARLNADGVSTLVLHGKSVPAHLRQSAIDVFQNGNYDGVAGGIKSIGTAVTITRARRVFVFELDWDPWDMIQAEDRAWRRGQLYDVEVEYIVLEGSLDAYLAYVNNEKIRIATEILDDPAYLLASSQMFH